MPKIVDQELEKIKIAEKAIDLFRKNGYSALSFRALARELGMSKSGLYHYFSGKEELFSFCGTIFLGQMVPDLNSGQPQKDLPADPSELLLGFARALQPDYLAELRLILDYADCFREKSELKKFLAGLEEQLSPVAGREEFPAALRLILGDLLVKALTDENDDWTVLKDQIGKLYAGN